MMIHEGLLKIPTFIPKMGLFVRYITDLDWRRSVVCHHHLAPLLLSPVVIQWTVEKLVRNTKNSLGTVPFQTIIHSNYFVKYPLGVLLVSYSYSAGL